MDKKKILEEITSEIEPIISQYNKVSHMFSENEAEQAFAKLNRVVAQIKFLLAAEEVKNVVIADEPYFQKPMFGQKPGSLVSVRPCGEEYGGKTFIGFLIGEMATGVGMSIKGDSMTIKFSGGNPCIFIPKTGTIVMGYESWWSEIKSDIQFKQITDNDIENVWYVKLWKQMAEERGMATNNIETNKEG